MTRTYTIRIRRTDGPATFAVALGDRHTVLDALFRIQAGQDSSLAFRCACRVGMCGTCALLVDRVPRLACRTRVATLRGARRGAITLAPLPHLPVVRDLVVSLAPFFAQWKRIQPALRGDPQPASAAGTAPADWLAVIPPDPVALRKRDCITCGICYAACGITRTNAAYLGPAAINRAFLRLEDPRDRAHSQRLRVLDDEWSGVWRCHTQFACTAACPKGIDLTDTIGRLKRAMPQWVAGAAAADALVQLRAQPRAGAGAP